MLEIAPKFQQYQFVIAGAPAIDKAFYDKIIQETKSQQPGLECSLIQNKTYDLLQDSTAALVTSGTATLETALFRVPQVVCYTGNKLSYLIAKRLINVKFIALANLIVDRQLITELIQQDLNAENLCQELGKLLSPDNQDEIQKGYTELRTILGAAGASTKVAQLIIEDLKKDG